MEIKRLVQRRSDGLLFLTIPKGCGFVANQEVKISDILGKNTEPQEIKEPQEIEPTPQLIEETLPPKKENNKEETDFERAVRERQEQDFKRAKEEYERKRAMKINNMYNSAIPSLVERHPEETEPNPEEGFKPRIPNLND